METEVKMEGGKEKEKSQLSDFFTFQNNLKIHCCFLHNKEHLTSIIMETCMTIIQM